MNGQQKLLKYETNEQVVNYLLRVLDSVTIKGEQAAQDLIAVKNWLRNPLNADEFEKDQLDKLKEKYEPVTSEKKSDKKDK